MAMPFEAFARQVTMGMFKVFIDLEYIIYTNKIIIKK